MVKKNIAKMITRQIKIPTIKVVPLVTEEIDSHKALLRSPSGKFLEIKRHMITRDLKRFLEEECNITIEFNPEVKRRGKSKVAGVKVKVLPISHTNYDGGAFIRIQEDTEDTWENTNKVTDFLADNGISWEKECIFTDEIACNLKIKK